MKKIIVGTFESRPGAETLVHHLRQELHVPQDDISFICRDAHGEVFEVIQGDEEGSEELSYEMKAGSLIGGAGGALAGAVMLFAITPALATIFSMNAVVFGIGMLASAAGTISVGAITGAIIGGVAASFFRQTEVHDEKEAPQQRDKVLVVAHARNDKQVGRAFAFHGASGVEIYTPSFSN
jgi:hypothetical protein